MGEIVHQLAGDVIEFDASAQKYDRAPNAS
jgi:hypothetical protein